MSKLRCHISISAGGFVAGPNQSEENPLGEGGERLHDWAVSLAAWRGSHGKQGGEVNESTPIMEETLENVGDGVMGRNMFGLVGGGDWRDEHQQYLAAGLLDELELHIVPVLLGDGARLFDNLGGAEIELEQVRAVEAPGVTYLKYRVAT
jgi:dihydrofolate reductase